MEYKNNYHDKELSKNLFAQLDSLGIPVTSLPPVHGGSMDSKHVYKSTLDLGNVL